MKRIIIAMKDRHQSQKLAIVLSHSYDSVIVDTPSKLISAFKNANDDFFSIIYEDSKDVDDFNKAVEELIHTHSLRNHAIQISSSELPGTIPDNRIVLSKPFGVQELIKAFNVLESMADSSSIAIA